MNPLSYTRKSIALKDDMEQWILAKATLPSPSVSRQTDESKIPLQDVLPSLLDNTDFTVVFPIPWCVVDPGQLRRTVTAWDSPPALTVCENAPRKHPSLIQALTCVVMWLRWLAYWCLLCALTWKCISDLISSNSKVFGYAQKHVRGTLTHQHLALPNHLGAMNALMAAWLSEKINCLYLPDLFP